MPQDPGVTGVTKATTDHAADGGGAVPRCAMVLAAGLGLRFRPVTEAYPKPLVEVAGRALIDWALDGLDAAGVTRAVVNTHYLGEMIARHLATRSKPGITLSPEEPLLDTGGGIAKALPLLGAAPFFVVNSDIAWRDGARPALGGLATVWDGAKMDALLLVHPVESASGYDGAGDYEIDGGGALTRRRDADKAPFVFTGIQILHPRLFAAAPIGAFPLVRMFDAAEAAGRLFGVVHDGEWFHVGTVEGLAAADSGLGLGR
jgi:MurNAc alpha-1-phosphate uridylyltransferase